MNKEAKIEKAKILNEKAIRRAKNSLVNFIEFTKEDYDPQWFHYVICDYLDRLYSGEIKKLMIFVPPQHGKSEISSRRFPAHILGRNPKTKIAVCSFSPDLASSFNRDIQAIMDNESYINIFPKTLLNSSRVSTDTRKGELRNTTIFETIGYRGYVKTVGIGQALTGTSVDIGIIDDPFKDRKTANSKIMRNDVWNWYNDVFMTRLHNNSKQLMLFTRWHEDDLAGRLLDPMNEHYNEDEAKEWTVIAIPALKEELPPLECAIDIGDTREIDEALWEKRHSAEKYKRRRVANPVGFASLDQQRPKPLEGNMIQGSWFQIINKNELPFNPDFVPAKFIIDGAYTTKTENDETATLSYWLHNGKIYIYHVDGTRKELNEYLKHFNTRFRLWGGKPNSSVVIEKKASGNSIGSMLSSYEYGNKNITYVPNKFVREGKYARVESILPFLESGKIVLIQGSWITSFIDQCESFPNAVHDDKVDTLCYAVLIELMTELQGSGVNYGEY